MAPSVRKARDSPRVDSGTGDGTSLFIADGEFNIAGEPWCVVGKDAAQNS